MMAPSNSDPRPTLSVVGELLEEDDDESGDDELDDEEQRNTGASTVVDKQSPLIQYLRKEYI